MISWWPIPGQFTKTCFGMEAEFTHAQNTQLHISKDISILGSLLYVIITILQLIGGRLRSTSEEVNSPGFSLES